MKPLFFCGLLVLLSGHAWAECIPSPECVQAIRDTPLNPRTLGEKWDAEQRVALMCKEYRECRVEQAAHEEQQREKLQQMEERRQQKESFDREVDQDAEGWVETQIKGKDPKGIRELIASQENWLKDHPAAEPAPDMHARIRKLRDRLRDMERTKPVVQ